MKNVFVNADNGHYDIVIGNGILKDEYLKRFTDYVIVTDDIVYELYKDRFPCAKWIVISAGEASKNMANLELIYQKLMEFGIDRKGAVAALGGGVVGDIAGFAAATFKRGVAFVQYPTTLLAQVDSSVGGKVAVNLIGGKNMVGAFYQPTAVIADTATLKTLDSRQYASGMAEVIKYAYIYDEALHKTLMSKKYEIDEIVQRCCEIKAEYVKSDPYDTGVRMQLNYGHTIGHAIETAAGYGKFLHGEAISVGMVCAAAIGEKLGISPSGLTKDTQELLKKYGLPYAAEAELLSKALNILSADKKAEGNKISFVLVDKIGHAVVILLEVKEIQKIIKELYL
ncbi:MAG: 3-dehydroquinate synthase [Christensenella sp.]